jgi:tRNA-2-methylthio-N6-dimethylallyladenosine synthase
MGKVVEVLVEGPSDEPGERLGRTPENRVLHLAAEEGAAPAGALVRARVTRAGGSSLSGTLA